MSDEQRQHEQQVQAAQTQPKKPKAAWGDPISEDRQQELLGMLTAWDAPNANHGERKGPFDRSGLTFEEQQRVQLTGADVSWLAEQSGCDQDGLMLNLHLEGASLFAAHLEEATRAGAHLERANLRGT